MKVEYIIAHYNEDLEWIKPFADKCIIYHKWNEEKPRFPIKKWIKLENVWREWHTYLYHIINNYNYLADINIFLQWNISDHSKNVFDNPLKYEKITKKYSFAIPNLTLFKKRKKQIIHIWKFVEMIKSWNMKKAQLNFSEFYKNIFGEKQPFVIPVFYWWNFWVSKKIIYSRDINFYKKIYNYLNTHHNPEEWHYLERLWFQVFNKNNQLLFKFFYIKQIINSIYNKIIWK